MSMSLSIGVLGLAVLGSGAVMAGLRMSRGVTSRHVEARLRWYLLPPRRGTTTNPDVLHGISDWEGMLDDLHITVPRALCGEILTDGPNAAPRQPTDSADKPPCQRCSSLARWMVGVAPVGPRRAHG